ncbi:hypothetical protein ACU8KH_05784 [Lachancea thermotolerans]
MTTRETEETKLLYPTSRAVYWRLLLITLQKWFELDLSPTKKSPVSTRKRTL